MSLGCLLNTSNIVNPPTCVFWEEAFQPLPAVSLKCRLTAFGDGDVRELGGAFVSISVVAIDDLSPEELEGLPVRTMDGRHDNWMEPPQHGGYL